MDIKHSINRNPHIVSLHLEGSPLCCASPLLLIMIPIPFPGGSGQQKHPSLIPSLRFHPFRCCVIELCNGPKKSILYDAK